MPGTVTDSRGTVWVIGCIFDSHMGWHIGPAIYAMARDNGMPESEFGGDENMARYNNSDSDADIDSAQWDIQLAEDWLNGLLPEGYGFDWFDGDYFLSDYSGDSES